jgi:two-component system sensor histidine kinase KdpD
VLTGIVYPLAVWGIAQAIFPAQAGGSLVIAGNKVAGSSLIGQNFSSPRYFQSRPSAAGDKGYDAANSSGSNLGPTNKALIDAVKLRLKNFIGSNPGADPRQVPVDLVTASGSGLDPEISPASAGIQVARVAHARGISEDQVRQLIAENTRPRFAGIFGEPGVNVLLLNIALDRDEKRPEPEAFLDLVPQTQRGQLKVYIGAAAGVGKTYRMLEEAHQLRDRGVDVVLGFIETHNRRETEERIGNLEIVARRKISYREVTLEEMDVDAIIARKPEFVIVDELAHTNAPGSHHEKRYQDVEQILATGINVITAMNIQHVESLNALLRRITGIDVRETVPDSILARADQIVNIDVPVEALRERLREGKIYPHEQIEHALKNFFKPSNLSSLRELALQEVARSLDRQRLDREALKREGGRHASVIERIMVGVSSNAADTGQLLRKASRIAGQLNAEWFAVHIETPAESVKNIGTKDFVALLNNINVASDLGAETVWLKSDDVVKALIDFAHDKGVTKLIVGRTHQPRWRRWLKGDVPARLVADARDLDVEIVATEEREESR